MVNEYTPILELYCDNRHGRPLMRESAGRDDMDNGTDMDEPELTRIENPLSRRILAGHFAPSETITVDASGEVFSFANGKPVPAEV